MLETCQVFDGGYMNLPKISTCSTTGTQRVVPQPVQYPNPPYKYTILVRRVGVSVLKPERGNRFDLFYNCNGRRPFLANKDIALVYLIKFS